MKEHFSHYIATMIDGPIDLWEFGENAKMLKVETEKGVKYSCLFHIKCECGKEFYVRLSGGCGFIYCPYCGGQPGECIV